MRQSSPIRVAGSSSLALSTLRLARIGSFPIGIETGEFSRTVQLPFRVETDKVTAHYANGILRITLPRLEADRPKQITVKATP